MLSQKQIKKQLDDNNVLIKELKPYITRQVEQLPQDIQDKLHDIQVGPKITTSGLESVKTILQNLYIAKYYLEEAYSDPKKFKKIYTQKLAPKPSSKQKPPPKPNAPQIKIGSETSKDKTVPKKEKIKISIGNPDSLQKQTENSKTESIPPTTKEPQKPKVSQKPTEPPPSSNIEL